MTMKTIDEVTRMSGIPARLIRGVIQQIGGDTESFRDVVRGGADAGFCGFTYYRDTVAFFKAYRPDIVELSEQRADEFGMPVIQMIGLFNCLAGRETPKQQQERIKEYTPSIARCLYGGRLTDDDDTVANALAWFALEEVARAFEED